MSDIRLPTPKSSKRYMIHQIDHYIKKLILMDDFDVRMFSDHSEMAFNFPTSSQKLQLRSPTDRQFGWSPACFAALRGDTQVLHQMLAMKVSVNDKVKADEKDLNINKGSSLLHICAQFCNNVAGPYWFAEMWPTKLYSKIEHTQTRIT